MHENKMKCSFEVNIYILFFPRLPFLIDFKFLIFFLYVCCFKAKGSIILN